MSSRRRKKHRTLDRRRPLRDVDTISHILDVQWPFFRDRAKEERKRERIINDDRRFFHPVVAMFPRRIDGVPAKVSVKGCRRNQTKERLGFDIPREVEVCKRRNFRRRILFINSRIGSGRKVKRERRWTEDSKIKC